MPDRSVLNVSALSIRAFAVGMVLAGVALAFTKADHGGAGGVALIVVGAGMFFIGLVQPTLSEFKIGPSGFSAKLRERDHDFTATLGPDAEGLMRAATWLAGSVEGGRDLVERALIETYLRWPQERSEGPADAVRKRLVELAPPAAKAPPAPSVSTVATQEGRPGDLLGKLLSLPVDERSAVVFNMLERMDVGAIASVTRREPAAVAADLDRAATELLASGAAAHPGETS